MKRTATKLRIRLLKSARRLWPRFAGPALPTKNDIKSIWLSRRAITAVVRLPGMKRFDRPLAWILGLPPRFLSNRVPVFKQPVRGGVLMKFRFWLWLHHAAGTSAWILVLLGINILLVSFVLGIVIGAKPQPISKSFEWMAPDLVTIAGYAGAIFGFMLTVVVFAAQIRSKQDNSMLGLSRFMTRKYHAYEILALAGAIAVANLLAALVQPLVAEGSLLSELIYPLYLPLLGINATLIPAVTALSLWALASIVNDSGERDMVALKPVIGAAMLAASMENTKQLVMADAFVRLLNSLGLIFNPLARSRLSIGEGDKRVVDIGLAGRFSDVDCVRLSELARHVQHLRHVEQLEFEALPGQQWSSSHGIVVTLAQSGPEQIETERELHTMQSISQRARSSVVIR